MATYDKNSIALWSTLTQIRLAIGVTEDHFAEMMKLTSKAYQRLLVTRESPGLLQIFNLLEHVNLSFENIMSGEIDYRALSVSYRKENDFLLPEKYRIAAFSKARNIQLVLNFLENFIGWRAAENVVRHFQIPKSVLTDPDTTVNVKLIADIYDYISKYYVHKDLLGKLGSFSRISNRGSVIEKILSKHTSVKSLYEDVFNNLICKFDENFDYSILDIRGKVIKVGVVQRNEVAEALKQNLLSTPAACAIRRGIGGSFAGYLGVSHAHAHESKCVHRGDPMCIYEFDIEQSTAEQKRKPKLHDEPYAYPHQ